MLEMNSLSSSGTAATFSMYSSSEKTGKQKSGKISQTKSTTANKKKSNFDAQRAMRKVAMAETKQTLRGVMSSLRNQSLRSRQYEDGDVMVARIKSVLRKAKFKMQKLTQEQQIAKEREAAKRENRLKLQSQLNEALQRRRLNRRMREWDDVKSMPPNTDYSVQQISLLQQSALDVTSADTAVVPVSDIVDTSSTAAASGSVDIIV